MQVAPGVHRIDGIRGVNAYAVLGDRDVTLVDTGFPGNADRILRQLRALGRDPEDVHTIVLTHGDTDHAGNVAALKMATGALVAIHEADAPALTGGPYERARGFSGAIFGLARALLKSRPFHPDVLLHDGDMIAGLRVHHVPGHTLGSIALESEDGVVFSGDALLGDSAGKPSKPTRALACDCDEALASALRIQELGYTLLLPGHGQPVGAQGLVSPTVRASEA